VPQLVTHVPYCKNRPMVQEVQLTEPELEHVEQLISHPKQIF
jgi:hypothetical protein